MSNIWDKLEDKPYKIKIGNSIKSKDVSYHSIKYNIKPPSIDHNKQGAIHCNQEDVYIVEYASQQSEEILQFSGDQMEANKELILFYDEETKTIILEKLDSTFNVRRDAFNKSKSILSELNNGEIKPQKPTTKTTRRTTKATTTKGKSKNNSSTTTTTTIPIPKPNQQDTFEEESVEEFEMSDNQNDENLDNRNPLAAYERMRAESKRAKKASETHTSSSKSQDNNEEDKIIKEFEANLEEFDLEEEAEKEIEEFALENELEQELEKELEVSGDDGEGENKLTDNELEEEVLEEINDTLELDSSEEDSEDNMSPNNKRKMDQESGSSKRSKPDVHDGPISLSAFAGNEEEDEESTESSSSDDD
ncbi:hypothetical protein BCR32DRAFT_293397 [Anaeromyces robustus]|uniref:Transcription elongation factor Eaf N-terminal domain-containing protein n=1 Tax=Anaeromyces robustus TaxID=1754192 RepID=A0A1Y1X5V6_9FUNG|nr:hypothetical protein BCR32DRAFT_293397 [Anaeromyces robustus]|eukprot:ORX81189.1 hypothetical protein BCR32DRAFT_293397 [Anaeromyces robustus]